MKIRAVNKKEPNLSVAEKEFLRNQIDFFNREDVVGKIGHAVLDEEHEPLTFNMHKSKYTPDFIAIGKNNQEMTVIEVKGSKHQKGYYYSRSRMLLAFNLFPCFHWIIVEASRRKKPNNWDWTYLNK